ncbi:AMIN domain-containing protein [Legionella sp. km772]|uniref:AMIN domain-containing protein n=1 Tax=Legionella sp. km772 TaxID=2498111 RepID=UPI000F8DFFEC|nr:AMIN domain-containing protein [Legionella sp. km772]RUR07408.1 AMIN domain-containing protein [Legionella sp. km772]
MRKIVAILLWISASISMAFANDNSLVSVKVFPLPDDRVRLDFQFSQPLKQQPASFITQNPARLVFDFVNTKMSLEPEQRTQKINLGSLNTYNIVAVGDRVRAILDLDRTVAYSGSSAGKVYSLIINGKSSDLFEKNKEVFITNQPVKAKNELKHLDFRGIEKEGGLI